MFGELKLEIILEFVEEANGDSETVEFFFINTRADLVVLITAIVSLSLFPLSFSCVSRLF